MAMNTGQASMTQTVGAIISANSLRKSLTLTNIGSNDVFIGNDGSVTASNAFKLAPGDTFVDEVYTGAYQGICDTGLTSTISYIEED